jgi:hypothetical protein
MLVLTDTLTTHELRKTHSSKGSSQGRATLRQRRHTHAKPQPFPSTPFYGPPFELVALGTRRFFALLNSVWKSGLTAPQIAGFTALAASQVITQNDGTTKLVTPREWFIWYNAQNYQNTFGPTSPIDPVAFPPLTNFPTTWNPPVTPFNPSAFAIAAGLTWNMNIQTTPLVSLGYALLLIPYWRANNRQTPAQPTIRVNALINGNTDVTGTVTLTVGFGGIIPSNAFIHGRKCILRLTSAAPQFVPSNPLEFTWP